MPGSAHVSYTTSGVLIVGGLFAFYKRKSVPSLVAGVMSGVLMAVSGSMISNDQEMAGHALGTITGLTASGMLLGRTITTKKVMPAGVLAGLIGLTALYNALKFNEYRSIAVQEQIEAQHTKQE